MTIDDAIRCARERAESWKLNREDCDFNNECSECATACEAEEKECEQLAEWLNELKKYKDAEEQGLLLKLPCKVGDKVYVLDRDGQPREMILDEPDIRCHCAKEDNLCMALCDRKNTGVCAYRFRNDGSDIGNTVFLTKEEAEQKLKEMGSDK